MSCSGNANSPSSPTDGWSRGRVASAYNSARGSPVIAAASRAALLGLKPARRSEATTALLRAQAAQEKFFVQFGRYAPALAAAPPDGLGLPATTESGFYGLTLAITEGGAGFRVTATVRPGTPQADDIRCASFAIDHNGLRSARNAADEDTARDCWR